MPDVIAAHERSIVEPNMRNWLTESMDPWMDIEAVIRADIVIVSQLPPPPPGDDDGDDDGDEELPPLLPHWFVAHVEMPVQIVLRPFESSTHVVALLRLLGTVTEEHMVETAEKADA